MSPTMVIAVLLGAVSPNFPGWLSPDPSGVTGSGLDLWEQVPTFDLLESIYPDHSKGRLAATVSCSIHEDGSLFGCQINEKYPPEFDALSALRRILPYFKVKKGISTAAGTYKFKIHFGFELTPSDNRDAPFAGNPCPLAFCIPTPPAPNIAAPR